MHFEREDSTVNPLLVLCRVYAVISYRVNLNTLHLPTAEVILNEYEIQTIGRC